MSRPMLVGRKAMWLVLILAAGAIAYLVVGGGPKTPKSVKLDEGLMKVQAPALLPMDAEQVSQVELTLSGQSIVAVKKDGVWMLEKPYSDQADGASIENVINLFSAIASDEPTDEGTNASYGFNKPYAKATFTANGQKHDFLIGKPGKEEVYYVKTSAAEEVYIVRGLPEELKVLRPIDLVNRQLLSFNPDDVTRIEAKTADGEVERIIERRDGKWFAGSGESGIVFEVEEFLRDLRYVNVSELVSAGAGQGLTPSGSTMHIELTRKDGKKHILDIGNKTEDQRRYYVKSSDRPHVYQVVQFIAENLREKMQRVGTDMMGLDVDRVQELRVITANEKSELTEKVFTKSDGNWTIDGKVAFSVSAVLDQIIGVSARSAAPDADDTTYGFNPAPNSMQIKATLDNKAVITLDLGNKTPDGNARYVRSSARQGVYLSDGQSIDNILAAVSKVRSELMVFDPAKVNRITVSESDWNGNTSSVTVSKQGNNWVADGKVRSADAVNAFLTTLRGLGAESIPPVQDEATYGFYPAAESWRVELRFTDGGTVTLDAGAKKSEGSGWFAIVNYYVRISDLADVVFVGEFDIDGLKDQFQAIMR